MYSTFSQFDISTKAPAESDRRRRARARRGVIVGGGLLWISTEMPREGGDAASPPARYIPPIAIRRALATLLETKQAPDDGDAAAAVVDAITNKIENRKRSSLDTFGWRW